MLIAARTGLVSDRRHDRRSTRLPPGGPRGFGTCSGICPCPSLALALPVAATLERLQSQATAETLAEPFVVAALARGVPVAPAAVARSAARGRSGPWRRSTASCLAGLLSGSFVVEIVTAWPGLGRLMYDALRARDLYLVAGCAAAGSVFLAVGSLVSDLALAAVDPRLRGE